MAVQKAIEAEKMHKDDPQNAAEPQRVNRSGSLCPAVKAADMIGDKWTLLIMRELLLGASRYNEFQRAMPRISPSLLSKRLKQMEQDGLLIKKSMVGERATEYRLTRCGRELAPLVNYMSKWGLRWARRRMKDEDLDVGSFMWDFHRTLKTVELPDGETVFSVTFSDLPTNNKWWLIVEKDIVDLCSDDPGKDVDLYITSTLPVLAQVWMGDSDISASREADDLTLVGAPPLLRSAEFWFPRSRYANVRPKRYVGDDNADR